MTEREPWLDRFPQIVLAIATAIVATDIIIGWSTGAFSRQSLSGTLSAIILNAVLALIAVVATVTAVFYWRKVCTWETRIIGLATDLRRAQQPEGPPIIPDVSDPGYPPLSNRQLADLYVDARPIAERTYSDAKLSAIAITVLPDEQPSIRIQFDFYSEHAGKTAEVDWENYGGFGQVRPGCDLELGQKAGGWDEPPWEIYPDWDKFYRLAYEKVQPLPQRPRVIVTSFFSENKPPWFFDFGHPPGSIPYAMTATGELINKSSPYSAKIALLDAIKKAFDRRPFLASK